MSTSIVDGVVEEAKLKRARAGISIFEYIRFKLDDDSSQTIQKPVLKQEVADALKPGSPGRFYLFSAFDLKGVHGVRRDGEAIFGFPGNNARLFVILGLLNLAWIAIRISTQGDIPLLSVLLMGLSVVGYILMSKGGREAKRQYDADNPSSAPNAAIAGG